MRNLKFFVCPKCGNLITARETTALLCCDNRLAPLKAKDFDARHQMTLTPTEHHLMVTTDHPMEKDHYIAFLAFITGEHLYLSKCQPEWDFQQQIPKDMYGMLYWYCTKDGLFRKVI